MYDLSIQQEPWKLLATLNHGTIYLRELETDEKREREASMSSREQEMCYWGYKFEDYMTRKGQTSSFHINTLVVLSL